MELLLVTLAVIEIVAICGMASGIAYCSWRDAQSLDAVGRTCDCVICLEDKDAEACVLPCGHTMHAECARRWVEGYSATCPVCRRPLRQTVVVVLDGVPLM